jgi:outer membrane protein TolC
VTQQLPYGGQVAARVINTLMRDIGQHVTSGESGDMILEANIPLLRGAGRVAYESRYQAERDLIYAVRNFENARRELVVAIAGDFFDLLARKTQIESAETAAAAAKEDLEKSQSLAAIGNVLQVEADRARVQYLSRSNDVVNARIAYQALLDRFKIRIGMPTLNVIDVVDVDLNISEPEVGEADAIETALKYRLDLINTLDTIDDAKRQVVIAQNNFLPQFDFTGRVAMATDPNQKNSLSYNTERTTWQAFLNLEVPLDRREERNVFRAALIQLRRAERAYDLAQDNVRLDVRDAIRAIEQARVSMEIQRENIEVNDTRREAARVQFELAGLVSNRDIVEAENDYQDARNAFAAALANYRLAILTFLRDTGTFRVTDDGQWE